MKDYFLFVKRFFSCPSIIGAIFPSSKKLAEYMTKQAVNKKNGPIRYLEVGAGSGALTQLLIPQLQEGDTLDIVELDTHFCKQLKRKYAHLPYIHVHEKSILDYDRE